MQTTNPALVDALVAMCVGALMVHHDDRDVARRPVLIVPPARGGA